MKPQGGREGEMDNNIDSLGLSASWVGQGLFFGKV